MKTSKHKIALGLTFLGIMLMVVYGVNAILDTGERAFLPFDVKTLGFVMGLPSMVLPFVAFAIMWKVPSSRLGVLFVFNGIIFLIGSIAFASMQETSATVEYSVIIENYYSLIHVIAFGVLIFFLGVFKIAKS